MEIQFINKNTSAILRDNVVQSQSDHGIVIHTDNSWKFIPAQEIEKQNIYDELVLQEPLPIQPVSMDTDPYLISDNTEHTSYVEKAEYRFGFSDLFFLNRQTAIASGIISDPVNIRGGDYITVSCESETEAGSIEIYIVEGTEETPILPEGCIQVEKEKLFYNQNTRFIVNTNEPVKLYQDDKLLSKDYTDITPEQFHEHTYTLSYIAMGTPDRYVPIGDTVRIKIIIRQYHNLPMVRIHYLAINQYGGNLLWNSNP